MKTSETNKLSFKRHAVVELSRNTLASINGGGNSILDGMPISTCLCPIITKITKQLQ